MSFVNEISRPNERQDHKKDAFIQPAMDVSKALHIHI